MKKITKKLSIFTLLLMITLLIIPLEGAKRKSRKKGKKGARTEVIDIKKDDTQYKEQGIVKQVSKFNEKDVLIERVTTFDPDIREDKCYQQTVLHFHGKKEKSVENMYKNNQDNMLKLLIFFKEEKAVKRETEYDPEKIQNNIVKEIELYSDQEKVKRTEYYYSDEYQTTKGFKSTFQSYREDGTLNTMEILLTDANRDKLGFDVQMKYFDETGEVLQRTEFIKDSQVIQALDKNNKVIQVK